MRLIVLAACLLLLANASTAWRNGASADVPPMLVAIERDLDVAVAHVAAMRERLAIAPPAGRGAAIVGIADGGSDSSLAALRWIARALDHRLEELRLDTKRPHGAAEEMTVTARLARAGDAAAAEALLEMRLALGDLLEAIAALQLLSPRPSPLQGDASRAAARDPEAAPVRARVRAIDDLDQSLAALAAATATMVSLVEG